MRASHPMNARPIAVRTPRIATYRSTSESLAQAHRASVQCVRRVYTRCKHAETVSSDRGIIELPMGADPGYHYTTIDIEGAANGPTATVFAVSAGIYAS